MNHRFNYRGPSYFLTVFAGTFLFWGIGGLMSFDPALADYYMAPMLLGLMMPAMVAVFMLWRQPDPGMWRDFARRLTDLRLIRPWPFLFTLGLMPLSVVISILISPAFGGSLEQFRPAEAFSFQTGFVPVLGLLFLAALFEELGWRGYGFESLEQGRSFLAASIIFGVLWSLWHLPLLWVNQSYQYEIYQLSPWHAVNFYLSTAVLGIIVSWVCHINRRSILVAILFHFVVNLSQEMLSMTQQTKGIQTFVLIAFTLVIIASQWSLFRRRG
jgi:membrane protease YdiL (CAAX protease family)